MDEKRIETLGDRLAAMARGEIPPPPVSQLLGLRLVSFGDANPMGRLQGGVICALADAAMGTSYATTLGKGETFTTLELKTNYLRQVVEGTLTATGRVIHTGRTIGLTTCDVVDEEGRLVAHATSTCMTLREAAG